MKEFRKVRLALAVSTLALLPTMAWAEDAEGQPAPENNAAAPEIIVTATRREEKLQDVPLAVTVFNAEARDRMGITSIQDFSNFTPGLSYDSANDRLSLRGVGRLTNTIGSDPGVAVYNDGFYTSSAWEATKTSMFVNRVEVLRGPQGTLYGRNSIGGSLNVISNRPTDEFHGEVRASVEEYTGAIVQGYVSGPLVGGLKTRLSIQGGPLHMGGVYHNIAHPERDEGFMQRVNFEAQVQYDFSPVTQLWLKWSHAEITDHTRGSNLVSLYATTHLIDGATELVPNAAYGYTVANPGVTDRFAINTNTRRDQYLTKNHNIVANFKTELGGTTLKYVGGYSQYLYRDFDDYDNTAATLVTTGAGASVISLYYGPYSYNPTYVAEYAEDKDYWSNEVTLSNTDHGRFNWLVGLYQYKEHYFQPYTLLVEGDATDTMSQALLNPVCLDASGTPQATCAPNPRRIFYGQTGDLTVKSYAAFGQADYELSPGLTATVGLRWSRDDKTGYETKRMVNWDPTFPVAACFGGCGIFTSAYDVMGLSVSAAPGATLLSNGYYGRQLKGAWDGMSWRLGLDYKPSNDLMVFGSYSRGFKAGGLNLGSLAPVGGTHTRSERVDAFELGFKSNPMPRTMFNATAFYYAYRDAQVPLTVQSGASVPTEQFFNIPRTRSIGLELEGAWQAAEWLNLSANYSYLDAKVTNTNGLTFQDTTQAGLPFVSIDGNRMPQVSKHKVAVSADISLPTSHGDFHLVTNYTYRSDAYYSIINGPRSLAPGWDQVDMRLSYKDPTDHFTGMIYVRNLFDTTGYLGSGALGPGSGGLGRTMVFTMPRSFGAEVQFKF